MIAIPKKPNRKLTARHQRRFAETMLPVITRVPRQAFCDLDAEPNEEAVAKVVAAAYTMFVGLVRDGRASLAYPTVLAAYGVRRVRIGRAAAAPQNTRDISSKFCQLRKGIQVERLDRYDRIDEEWQQALAEDRRRQNRHHGLVSQAAESRSVERQRTGHHHSPRSPVDAAPPSRDYP